MSDNNREMLRIFQEGFELMEKGLASLRVASVVIEEDEYDSISRHDGERLIYDGDLHQLVGAMNKAQSKSALIRVIDGWNGPDAIMESVR